MQYTINAPVVDYHYDYYFRFVAFVVSRRGDVAHSVGPCDFDVHIILLFVYVIISTFNYSQIGPNQMVIDTVVAPPSTSHDKEKCV